MTISKAQEMKAGKEMDLLVDEMVMRVIRERGVFVPPYSTDTISAWQVVEHILSMSKPFNQWGDSERLVSFAYVPGGGWEVRIHENHWNWPMGPADEPGLDVELKDQPTFAVAICRVALIARLMNPKA